jgi:hypothetical protein
MTDETTTVSDPYADVMQHLKYWCNAPSDVGLRVAKLLDEWDGLHHFDQAMMKKVEWTNTHFIAIKLGGGLASFDFNNLTRLIFLAHDHCIRVEIAPLTFKVLRVLFHPRHKREGNIYERHPTLEQAVGAYRGNHPAPPSSVTSC